ncbi:MAG: DUF2887 domain-containing protein, partial [Cyanobium sp.]
MQVLTATCSGPAANGGCSAAGWRSPLVRPSGGILGRSCAPLGPAAVTISDKLFYWVFQNNPDWILELQPDLAKAAGGYRFSAPVLKERER